MSKKRSKNSRKKQLKIRSNKGGQKDATVDPQSKTHRTTLEQSWDDAYQAPEVVRSVPESGGGGFGKIHSAMTRGEEGDGASLLRKRRGCGELTLWLLGGSAVFYAVMKLMAFAYEAGLEPSSPVGP